MDAIDKARELGAQHGREKTESWWPTGQTLPNLGPSGEPAPWKPEPNLLDWHLDALLSATKRLPGNGIPQRYRDAYCDAFRQARDEAIQARCEP